MSSHTLSLNSQHFLWPVYLMGYNYHGTGYMVCRKHSQGIKYGDLQTETPTVLFCFIC